MDRGEKGFAKLVGFVILNLGGEFVKAGENSHIEIEDFPNEFWVSLHGGPSLQGVLGRLEEVKKMEIAGNYENVAQFFESLGAYEKAGELRRKGRTHYEISFKIGRDGVIKIQCPHCGASQPTESKSKEVTCKYCGKTYIVPKKILDMI